MNILPWLPNTTTMSYSRILCKVHKGFADPVRFSGDLNKNNFFTKLVFKHAITIENCYS